MISACEDNKQTNTTQLSLQTFGKAEGWW